MNPASNLVLVGPMGAGKSCIGRRLAAHFGLPLVDADLEIERRAGAPVTTIFECEGETGFRARERTVLAELVQREGIVLATGGGAVLDPQTRQQLQARGFVVHLHATPDEQLQRLARDRSRPLLAQPDRTAVLNELARLRDPLYAQVADLRFDTVGLTADAAAHALAAVLQAQWQRPSPFTQDPRMDDPSPEAGMQLVEVGGDAPYRVAIGPGLLDDGPRLAATLRGRHALLVSDANVAPLYADRLHAALARARPGLSIGRYVMPAGESEKTLHRFGECLDALARLGATRDAGVYALGGGVVGDLAGFAAACWMRGIDVVQVPTTLLAMVDSSVGGKTAVDLPAGKNLVGAFHPPRAVIADTATLRTLPDRELRAGLAEVVKYGAIFDAAFLDWLENNIAALLARDDAALAEAIARACRYKADVVARDPFEHGDRALLNFGHTFGHAIEAEQGYAGSGDGLNHGEAVAVGMVLAARLSTRMGLAPAGDAARLQRLLEAFGLPVAVPAGLSPDALLARMRLDKKAAADGLRFILWDGAGRARVVAGIADDAVLQVLDGAV